VRELPRSGEVWEYFLSASGEAFVFLGTQDSQGWDFILNVDTGELRRVWVNANFGANGLWKRIA
jgi:hypothetical protein